MSQASRLVAVHGFRFSATPIVRQFPALMLVVTRAFFPIEAGPPGSPFDTDRKSRACDRRRNVLASYGMNTPLVSAIPRLPARRGAGDLGPSASSTRQEPVPTRPEGTYRQSEASACLLSSGLVVGVSLGRAAAAAPVTAARRRRRHDPSRSWAVLSPQPSVTAARCWCWCFDLQARLAAPRGWNDGRDQLVLPVDGACRSRRSRSSRG